MVHYDDLMNSLLIYLQTETFTGRQPDGALATGTLIALYPDLATGADGRPHFFPMRLYNTQKVAYPALALAIGSSPTVADELFGSTVWHYQGRLIVLGTAPDATGEKEFDESVFQTIQMQSTLEHHFKKDEIGELIVRAIPWYTWTYAADGGKTLLGTFRMVLFDATVIDDNRFLVNFVLELVD